jgi:hypothetical protein
MIEETQMSGTLLDFIWKAGAMDGVYIDNIHVQIGYSVNDIRTASMILYAK